MTDLYIYPTITKTVHITIGDSESVHYVNLPFDRYTKDENGVTHFYKDNILIATAKEL